MPYHTGVWGCPEGAKETLVAKFRRGSGILVLPCDFSNISLFWKRILSDRKYCSENMEIDV